MLEPSSPLRQLSHAIASGGSTLAQIAADSVRSANGNASHNTYIYFNEEELREQARSLSERFEVPASRPPLFGVPISLKDCFDLAGTVTTLGTKFYAARNARWLRGCVPRAR